MLEYAQALENRLEGHVLLSKVQVWHEIRVPGLWRIGLRSDVFRLRCREALKRLVDCAAGGGSRDDGGARVGIGRPRVGWTSIEALFESVVVVLRVGRIWLGVVRVGEERKTRCSVLEGESRTLQNHRAELGKRDALVGIAVEGAAKNLVEVVGDWKDSLEEARVTSEGGKGGVVHGCTFPRVTSAGEIDEDDAQRPDVVGSRGVMRALIW